MFPLCTEPASAVYAVAARLESDSLGPGFAGAGRASRRLTEEVQRLERLRQPDRGASPRGPHLDPPWTGEHVDGVGNFSQSLFDNVYVE